MKKFQTYVQHDAVDCGPTCLRMIAKYYGKTYTLQTLRERSHLTREGVSLLDLSEAAESIGFRTMAVKIPFARLQSDAPLPCVAHWKQNHFVVVYKIKKDKVYVADPASGLITYSQQEFMRYWASSQQRGILEGICLVMEPTKDFYETDDEIKQRNSLSFLSTYLKPHKKLFIQLIIGLIAGSLLQLIFPFLTQSIVDIGIVTHDIGFIYLVLIAQLTLFISRMAANVIRSWILLHISARVNISLISDFLVKLMRLPIAFFDTKMIGDLTQRIHDHTRIENFLTTSTLVTLFSLINIVVFGIVLAIYSWEILLIYLVGTGLYFLWVSLFIKKRRVLDYQKFSQLSDNQSKIYQIITGMQEIKLNNTETTKRWEWEKIQARLFKINIKALKLHQYQTTGATFFNELKNIFIIFLSAKFVLDGHMTLGAMLSAQYILGQTNVAVEQTIQFLHLYQDAEISIERLREIHTANKEEDTLTKIKIIPQEAYYINNLTFQYAGSHSPKVLEDINLTIPKNKITAIVGTSGSGKTTLVKLLLGFYTPQQGNIKIGSTDLSTLNPKSYRQKTAAVLQEGYLFSDTIANNIAISDEYPDTEKLLYAVKLANIQDFIESLPLSYNTKIGNEGMALSQGQKQRILIARAVYKNPNFLFFDEATNALDANNEKAIMKNLNEFFQERTVVTVAHRLSTVKNAHQIVVLEQGRVVEQGTHEELTVKRGAYYHLVKNQLELGG